jgi:hypothetical protein
MWVTERVKGRLIGRLIGRDIGAHAALCRAALYRSVTVSGTGWRSIALAIRSDKISLLPNPLAEC